MSQNEIDKISNFRFLLIGGVFVLICISIASTLLYKNLENDDRVRRFEQHLASSEPGIRSILEGYKHEPLELHHKIMSIPRRVFKLMDDTAPQSKQFVWPRDTLLLVGLLSLPVIWVIFLMLAASLNIKTVDVESKKG